MIDKRILCANQSRNGRKAWRNMKRWQKWKTWLKEGLRQHFGGDAAGTALTGAVGFFLARAVIYGAFAPFGVAFLALPMRNWRATAAFVGVIAGSVSAAGTVDSLRYVAAALIVASVRFILRAFRGRAATRLLPDCPCFRWPRPVRCGFRSTALHRCRFCSCAPNCCLHPVRRVCWPVRLARCASGAAVLHGKRA